MASTDIEVSHAPDAPAADNRVSAAAAESTFAAEEDSERITPAIEFRDVHLSFDERKVLNGLSFKVAKGETKIILGGSGGGKSTVIKLVLGLLKPDSGRIMVNGEDITEYTEAEMMRVRKNFGMVFQEGALFDSLSVYENVAYRLHEQGIPEDEVEQEVRRMLRFVNLEDAIDKMPAELSGGMRRRVGIARALVGGPTIVMFDEPTAGLDPPTRTHHLRTRHQTARPRRRFIHLRHARDEQRRISLARVRGRQRRGRSYLRAGRRTPLPHQHQSDDDEGRPNHLQRHGRNAPEDGRLLHQEILARTLNQL
jgi:ABC-type transporter Mla maintaining outer membrane lipid asymmetry ATPase subunit MlaF